MMSQCVCSADEWGSRGGSAAHEHALHHSAAAEPGLNSRCCFQRTRDNRGKEKGDGRWVLRRGGLGQGVTEFIFRWMSFSVSLCMHAHGCERKYKDVQALKHTKLLTCWRIRMDLPNITQYSEEIHFLLVLLLLLFTFWPDGRCIKSDQNLKETGSKK